MTNYCAIREDLWLPGQVFARREGLGGFRSDAAARPGESHHAPYRTALGTSAEIMTIVGGARRGGLMRDQDIAVALWASEPYPHGGATPPRLHTAALRPPLVQAIANLLLPAIVVHQGVERHHYPGRHPPISVPVVNLHRLLVGGIRVKATGLVPVVGPRSLLAVWPPLGGGPRKHILKVFERRTLHLGHFDSQTTAETDTSLCRYEGRGPVQITNGNHILSCPITHQGLERIQPTDLVYQNNITAGPF